jgi:hypothetical protein
MALATILRWVQLVLQVLPVTIHYEPHDDPVCCCWNADGTPIFGFQPGTAFEEAKHFAVENAWNGGGKVQRVADGRSNHVEEMSR